MCHRHHGLFLITLLIFCTSEIARLHRQLSAREPQKRAAAAKRLGELHDQNSLPLLLPLLNDSSPEVRFEVALALGKIGNPDAITSLAEAIKTEPREDVAMVMTKSLGNLGPAAIDPLINLTVTSRPLVRMTACRALGRIGSHRAVDPLIRRLDDPDPNVRKTAIIALRRIGDPKGMEAIARKITSPDRTTEQTAEEALSGRGYDEQLDQIRHLLRTLRR